MGARAGRRFLLAPTRPVLVRPSSRYNAPLTLTLDAAFAHIWVYDLNSSVAPVAPSATLVSSHTLEGVAQVRPLPRAAMISHWLFPGDDAEGYQYVTGNADDATYIALFTSADADRRYTAPPIDFDQVPVRTYLKVTVDFDDPAIINGRPYSPRFWAQYNSTATTSGGIQVVPEPPPPVLTFPSKPGARAWIWYASDLAKTSSLTTWPEHSGGPSWRSGNGYEPSVTDRVTFGKQGRYRTQSKVVYFDYRRCEHMWIDLGQTFSDDFTWIFCGIILNYPTARYGHYVLDAGWNTPRVSPLPATERSAKILTGQPNYRAAMLYQRNSTLQGSHTGADLARDGRHIRIQNNYHPSPRMMYSIWNRGSGGNKGTIGTMGRRYKKRKGGTIDAKNFRKFVTGRRYNKVSTALASHMVLFEIRFYPRALSAAELDRQYRNLASRYKFDRYPT